MSNIQVKKVSGEEQFKNVISHAKEYGFIFQSSEIYDGLSAVYDYGQMGAELKKNIRDYWWKSMVQLHENIVGIDASIFMHPTTWKASGHVDAFNDPLIDNKDSKNIDNVYGQSFLMGYYTEMKDPKNADKTVDELKQIVLKTFKNNLVLLICKTCLKMPISTQTKYNHQNQAKVPALFSQA